VGQVGEELQASSIKQESSGRSRLVPLLLYYQSYKEEIANYFDCLFLGYLPILVGLADRKDTIFPGNSKPLIRMEKKVEDIRVISHLTQRGKNPKAISIFRM